MLILGVCSLHPEFGITVLDLEESYVKRAMIANAVEVVAVSSAEKLGSAGPALWERQRAHAPRQEARRSIDLDPFAPRDRRGGGLMRAHRLAIGLFFFGDGLLIGSWAAGSRQCSTTRR